MEGVPLLRVEGLCLGLAGGPFLLKSVSFHLQVGEILGLVGESGCGKSLTGLSCLGLFPPGVIPLEGRVLFRDQDLLSLSTEERRRFRGRHLALIFQEPLSALNPVFTIGYQIEEVLLEHRGLRGKAAREETLRLLAEVRLPDPEVRYRNYPHELSGGMRQRAMIAMALAGEPEVLVADEPTTALDVTVQAQILELFKELRARRHLAFLFISHDLSVIQEVADRVAVMYAGEIVEEASREALFEEPLHPYTRGLLAAFPRLGVRRLEALPGQVPSPGRWPVGCRFAPRCPERKERCVKEHPELREVNPGRKVRCFRR
ncbi:MAG: ABC transporter ATP-binding protein [Thermodesulfatator sp.]|nr:MAG: ABC transporter ATP-binding protein [Thermodesulfatator sp.]